MRRAGSGTQPASQPAVHQAWPYNTKEALRQQDAMAEALGVEEETVLNPADNVPMKFAMVPAGRFPVANARARCPLQAKW